MATVMMGEEVNFCSSCFGETGAAKFHCLPRHRLYDDDPNYCFMAYRFQAMKEAATWATRKLQASSMTKKGLEENLSSAIVAATAMTVTTATCVKFCFDGDD